MSIFIFIFLVVGIIVFRFARKLQWEDRLIRKRKERKKEWVKKQKQGSPHGKRVRRSNRNTKRKR